MRSRTSLAAVLATLSLLVGFAGASPLTVGTASAANNGVGLKPLMGWSSWSFLRKDPTAAKVEAQAEALVSSGLSAEGFQNVNLDDFWYQCPGSQGPNVDGYGRWVTDPTRFPPSGSTDGMQVTANYVHAKGLKFGLYVTPGISKQAVAQNTPIQGTGYHAADIATTNGENNYNCGGMVGIDYSKPGAQAFVNSWANEFASWGVDYVKIDGVGTGDVPDIQAWSTALQQTGRPIHLELSNNLSPWSASTWRQYANGWRTGGDVECYCSSGSFPLTSWGNVQYRFAAAAEWQPYGGPGGFNDYDSLEVGNGSNTGLTPPERQSTMSLWAMAASPLILGTDLTNLDATDLSYLKNTAVLAVDQDGIDAARIVSNGNQQVYAKTESDGSVIIGLFNYSDTASQSVTVDLASAGVGGATTATDLWSGNSVGTISGTYTVNLAPGAVQLLKTAPGAGTNRLRIAAEDYHNTLAGAVTIASCSGCSDGQKVGYLGNGSANYLTFTNVNVSAAGPYTLGISYLVSGTRTLSISVNGGPDTTLTLTGSSWSTPATTSIPIQLNAGTNTIKFHNDTAYAPDLDLITVTPPTLNGIHQIAVSGQALDDPNSSTTAGTQLITYGWHGGTNQQWTLAQQPDGSYTLTNVSSGLCADDSGASTNPGNPIIQWSCNGQDNQRWTPTQQSNGTYTLTNRHSGLLLTTASTSNNALVTQQANSGSALQQWTIN